MPTSELQLYELGLVVSRGCSGVCWETWAPGKRLPLGGDNRDANVLIPGPGTMTPDMVGGALQMWLRPRP